MIVGLLFLISIFWAFLFWRNVEKYDRIKFPLDHIYRPWVSGGVEIGYEKIIIYDNDYFNCQLRIKISRLGFFITLIGMFLIVIF